MSSITASRTPRLAPPVAPTRRATPRRRTTGEGAFALGLGLGDRPMLRIVADDERAPVFTRVAPARGVPEVTDLPDPSGIEARPVDLSDFFAAEYDGDDVSVQVVAARPSSVRLTRRGRLVAFGVSLVAVLGLGLVAASGSLADDKPEPLRVVTVQPGQTLWSIASGLSGGGGDIRSRMAHLEALNHLDSASLQIGQHLRVPR